MKKLLTALLLLLTACVADSSRTKKIDPALVLAQLAQLPGVTIESSQPPQFSYPEQTMFADGAVFPLPGGTPLLEPLALFLTSTSGSWRADVRAKTTYGPEYDQLLAEKRSELLATYLSKKGVDLQLVTFYPQAAEGPPLTLTLILPPGAADQ
jgi:hypothetical protein